MPASNQKNTFTHVGATFSISTTKLFGQKKTMHYTVVAECQDTPTHVIVRDDKGEEKLLAKSMIAQVPGYLVPDANAAKHTLASSQMIGFPYI